MYNNLTIRGRLVAVLSLLSCLLLAVGGAGLAGMRNSQEELHIFYEERLVSLGQLDGMMNLMLRNQLSITRAANMDTAIPPDTIEQIERNRDAVSKLWQEYSKSFAGEEEREMAERFEAAHKHFMLDALAPALVAAKAGDIASTRAHVNGPLEQMFPQLRVALEKLVAYQLEHGKTQYAHAEQAHAKLHLLVTALLAAGLALAAGIGWQLVRGITLPLGRAATIAQSLARGDLTQTVEVASGDETGRVLAALREMSAGLAGMVGTVRQATHRIQEASAHIASGEQDLSRRIEEQASALEETAASMEELTITVVRNADNARQVNLLAQNAANHATRGGAAIFQVAEKMGAISESSRRIIGIVGEIDSIAAQEIRQLAAHTIEQVDAGSVLAKQAGSTMGEVVREVHHVSGLINEITAASYEQTVSIGQVNQALLQIDAATQQNVALAGQAAATAASMQKQAQALAKVVGVFRLAGQAPAPAANKRHSHQLSLA